MTPVSIRHLANPSLPNDVACFYLRKLDPQFNEIIKPESADKKFSEQVFSKYHQMCKKNFMISDIQPPSWATQHFNEHPPMRMAAIAEVLHEICLKVLEEKTALTYRVDQLRRDIGGLSERIITDLPILAISTDHLASLEGEIALLREEKEDLKKENARLRRENIQCKKLPTTMNLDDSVAQLKEKIAVLEAQNLELWHKFIGGAISTESPLRNIPIKTLPT